MKPDTPITLNSPPYFVIGGGAYFDRRSDTSYAMTSVSSFNNMSPAIDATVWKHIAIVKGAVIYVNGIAQTSSPTTGDITLSGFGTGGGNKYLGMIKDVRLWNVSRTATQILDNYLSPPAPTTTGLVNMWSLNGNGNDSVGGKNGTATGTITYAY